MSTQNIIYSQRTTEASPSAGLREKARVFINRNRLIAFLELLILALLFAAPFFTFSSGILGFPFVLLRLPARFSWRVLKLSA